MVVVETLQLDASQCGWIVDLILTSTNTSFDELYQVYNQLLSHPSVESQPFQVNKSSQACAVLEPALMVCCVVQIHLLQSVALLLEKWVNSADPVNQSLFCNAVIDFDEFMDIITRNAMNNILTHQKRTWLMQTFNTIKAKREHLIWT